VTISIRKLDVTGVQTVQKRGKLVHSQNVILDFNREIQELEKGKHTST
jgi:hypothetical protein